VGLYVAGQYIAAAVAPLFVVPWYGFAPSAWLREILPFGVGETMRTYNPRLTV
jgi:hypothetical protein